MHSPWLALTRREATWALLLSTAVPSEHCFSRLLKAEKEGVQLDDFNLILNTNPLVDC